MTSSANFDLSQFAFIVASVYYYYIILLGLLQSYKTKRIEKRIHA
jgi:preprotein translocase subunit SecG